MFGFTRVTALGVPTFLGDVDKNAASMKEAISRHGKDSSLLVFPALSITGATLGDLFFQMPLIEATKRGISTLLEATRGVSAPVIFGAPVYAFGKLYNAAVVLQNGRICGVVPKTYLSSAESRVFSAAPSAQTIRGTALCEGADYDVPFGNLLFDGGIRFGIEIDTDAFSPLPPSAALATCGAELIINPGAVPEATGGQKGRKSAILAQSARLLCGYVAAYSGHGESTTDFVFSGQCVFAARGRLLAENNVPFSSDYAISMDFDIEELRAKRLQHKMCGDAPSVPVVKIEKVPESDGTLLPLRHLPFVPTAEKARRERSMEIFSMQVEGLVKRLETVGSVPVIGVSGGLDSTLALLVAAAAMQKMGRDMRDTIGVTMPCFGTTDRTLQNALALMEAIGITSRTIPIKDAVNLHFKDIGHDASVHDTTYENAQARERTQVLMDVAGEVGGLVVGTGDLSELALGWCTYNADHMSMYGVNSGVPKTLIRWIIDFVTAENLFPSAAVVLRDIMDTPISPELLPPDTEGRIAQRTEDLVGPYALHDFFLYYMLGYGFSPAKIYYLALRAFSGMFEKQEILKWLHTFYRRFFTQQFKRSCMPDGVSIGSIGLSPRGTLSMPSDAIGRVWLEEIEKLQ